MDAFGLANGSPEEKAARKAAIQEATRYAIEVPYKVMQLSASTLTIIHQMADQGNQTRFGCWCGCSVLELP